MELIGRAPPAKFTKKKVLGFFSTWHIWLLTPRECTKDPIRVSCADIHVLKSTFWFANLTHDSVFIAEALINSSTTAADHPLLWYSGTLPNDSTHACILTRYHRLKSFNTPGHTVYSIGQINTYPLGINAIQVVTSKCLDLNTWSTLTQFFFSNHLGVLVWCYSEEMAANNFCWYS